MVFVHGISSTKWNGLTKSFRRIWCSHFYFLSIFFNSIFFAILALEKVDNQINEFTVQLKEKLFDFPSVLEEQRRLIR